ncbi:RHS repeat-associated core domain-containing protein [Pseudomonas syringae]|uniref:RHS repeat-associated core domain-containing protein n=1 Tax=Pseudomonas syringae TaxID=317 RepID=UPI00101382C6|nr:RHS repeat-associated core domain-containing protein [Pseudomonas syringae]RXT88454.1 RHS repeat-associated core domain-containing protein [Pseudomonas syringae]
MDDTPEGRRVLCRYRYDALDRVAVVDPDAQEAVSRFYQKKRLTVEIQGAMRRRVFLGEDRLLAEYQADGAAERVDLLGTDRQSSVLHALSSEGRQPLAYSPYGHRAQGGPFSGFNGERADPVTGHYLLGNGYRAFNPVLMRFNRPDSLSPFGRGGLNAYAYCQGDPVNRSDPGGHISSFRVLGLTMFPKRFDFQNLPNEMIGQVIKHMHVEDAFNLSRTSTKMRTIVPGLLDTSLIDLSDPRAQSTVFNVLAGKTGLSPTVLKKGSFKTGFEAAAKNADQKMTDQMEAAKRAEQSFFEEFTGIPGADENQFNITLAEKLKEHAESPEIRINIDKDVAERTKLRGAFYIQRGLKGKMERRVADIRSLLNTP